MKVAICLYVYLFISLKQPQAQGPLTAAVNGKYMLTYRGIQCTFIPKKQHDGDGFKKNEYDNEKRKENETMKNEKEKIKCRMEFSQHNALLGLAHPKVNSWLRYTNALGS